MQVFSKEWFETNSNKLQWFANSWLGKKVLGLGSDDVVLNLGPHDVILLEQIATKNGYIKCKFVQHVEPIFAKRLRRYLWPLWAGMHCVDSLVLDHQSLVPDFGFATFTQNVTTGTGTPYINRTRRDASPAENWSTIRAGSASSYSVSTLSNDIGINISSSSTSLYDNILRSTFGFDLSSFLTNALYITTAELHIVDSDLFGSEALYTAYTTNDPGSVGVVTVDVSSKTSADAETADHVAGTTTEVITRFRDTAPGTFTNRDLGLNVAGRNAIKSTLQQSGGYYKQLYLQTRFGGDIDNLAPNSVSVNKDYDYNSTTRNPSITVEYEYPISVNVGDVWKSVSDIWVNVGDVWKPLDELYVNVSDVWKKILD